MPTSDHEDERSHYSRANETRVVAGLDEKIAYNKRHRVSQEAEDLPWPNLSTIAQPAHPLSLRRLQQLPDTPDNALQSVP
jgi:hypothetical protein